MTHTLRIQACECNKIHARPSKLAYGTIDALTRDNQLIIAHKALQYEHQTEQIT